MSCAVVESITAFYESASLPMGLVVDYSAGQWWRHTLVKCFFLPLGFPVPWEAPGGILFFFGLSLSLGGAR